MQSSELAGVGGPAHDELMKNDVEAVKTLAKMIGYDGLPSDAAAEQLGFSIEQVRDALAFVPTFVNLVDAYRSAKLRDLAAQALKHLSDSVETGEMTKDASRLQATVNAAYKEARAGERETSRQSSSKKAKPLKPNTTARKVTVEVQPGQEVQTRQIEGSISNAED